MLDENNYIFIALASAQYPRKTLGNLLTDLKTDFYLANPTMKNPEIRPIPQSVENKFLMNLAQKYTNPTEFTNLSPQSSPKIKDLQQKIKESMRLSPDLTKEISEPVMNIEKNEGDEKCRNCMEKTILFGFVFSIALYIIVPIIVSVSQ